MKKMVDGVLMDMDEADIAQYEAMLADQEAQKPTNARHERNNLLAATDWWVARATETGVPMTQEQMDYRQALRDVPTQEGFPNDIVWPELPGA